MLTISLMKTDPRACVPQRGSEKAAGYDLRACLPEDTDSVAIAPGQSVKIGTGLKIAVPEGYFGAIFARSGLAAKEGLRPANCVGVADSDYRGEYLVVLHNDSGKTRHVRHGDRIAQLVILPCPETQLVLTDCLDETPRGEGGFGSTGKQ